MTSIILSTHSLGVENNDHQFDSQELEYRLVWSKNVATLVKELNQAKHCARDGENTEDHKLSSVPS